MATPDARRRLWGLRRTMMRSTATWTAAGSLVVLPVAHFGVDRQLATSIALGALVALANFLLLAGSTAQAIDRAAAPTGETPRIGFATLARAPLVLLALLGILWYMPARPEGLAIGVLIVLISAVAAAVRAKRAIPPSTHEHPNGFD